MMCIYILSVCMCVWIPGASLLSCRLPDLIDPSRCFSAGLKTATMLKRAAVLAASPPAASEGGEEAAQKADTASEEEEPSGFCWTTFGWTFFGWCIPKITQGFHRKKWLKRHYSVCFVCFLVSKNDV